MNIGFDANPMVGDMGGVARKRSLSEKVLCPGRLFTNDLQLLYSCADLFVFPSLYEGFEMPALEAMACGAPVLTSKSTALAEVAGDAAVLADPTTRSSREKIEAGCTVHLRSNGTRDGECISAGDGVVNELGLQLLTIVERSFLL